MTMAEFFGGPCDGLVREMYETPWQYRVPVPAPFDYNTVIDAQLVETRTLTYDRRQHRTPGMVAYIFRGHPRTPPGGQRSASDAPTPTDIP